MLLYLIIGQNQHLSFVVTRTYNCERPCKSVGKSIISWSQPRSIKTIYDHPHILHTSNIAPSLPQCIDTLSSSTPTKTYIKGGCKIPLDAHRVQEPIYLRLA